MEQLYPQQDRSCKKIVSQIFHELYRFVWMIYGDVVFHILHNDMITYEKEVKV